SLTLIRGASGIGKTTLLDCLAGFETPNSGTVCWAGREFHGLAPHRRPLSLLQQSDNLFPHLSLLENVCLAAEPGWRITFDIKAQAAETLSYVGLAEVAAQYPEQVSGGEAQRAGLARALLRHQYAPRPILLLDEPYSALDDTTTTTMHQLIQKLCQKHQLCVLLVAHRKVPCDQVWRLETAASTVQIRQE
ncbi:MAG: ATP-binding cassette domain-containing protein, partial [Alphaproteobacteria bacterium]|nr:ATP-binding cassette domain-containing protein [Alphaproteobacteria bacterium]